MSEAHSSKDVQQDSRQSVVSVHASAEVVSGVMHLPARVDPDAGRTLAEEEVLLLSAQLQELTPQVLPAQI